MIPRKHPARQITRWHGQPAGPRGRAGARIIAGLVAVGLFLLTVLPVQVSLGLAELNVGLDDFCSVGIDNGGTATTPDGTTHRTSKLPHCLLCMTGNSALSLPPPVLELTPPRPVLIAETPVRTALGFGKPRYLEGPPGHAPPSS